MPHVTPFVGVWIEIFSGEPAEINHWMSLPSWECGLKFWLRKLNKMEAVVTPFVGVWIEIMIGVITSKNAVSHSLRGSVD